MLEICGTVCRSLPKWCAEMIRAGLRKDHGIELGILFSQTLHWHLSQLNPIHLKTGLRCFLVSDNDALKHKFNYDLLKVMRLFVNFGKMSYSNILKQHSLAFGFLGPETSVVLRKLQNPRFHHKQIWGGKRQMSVLLSNRQWLATDI